MDPFVKRKGSEFRKIHFIAVCDDADKINNIIYQISTPRVKKRECVRIETQIGNEITGVTHRVAN